MTALPPVIATDHTDLNGNVPRNRHFKFSHWTNIKGDVVSYESVYTTTVTDVDVLTAHFTFDPDFHGTGYYRVRSMRHNGKEYLKMVGDIALEERNADKLNGHYYMTPNMVLTEYKMTPDQYYPNENYYPYRVDDPGTIMYFSGDFSLGKLKSISELKPFDTEFCSSITRQGANISSQGASAEHYLEGWGRSFTVKTGQIPGYYSFRPNYNSNIAFPKYLYRLDDSRCYGGLSLETTTGMDATYDLQPLDEQHIDQFYFAAMPEENSYSEDSYWTTMYTTFPYECYDDVEAYTLKVKDASCDFDLVRVPTQSGAGRDLVPANTAVLLRCKGTDPADNRLLPLDPGTNIPAIENNYLKGELQLNTSRRKGANDEETALMYCYSWNYTHNDYAPVTDKTYLFTLPKAGASYLVGNKVEELFPVNFMKPETTDCQLTPNTAYLDTEMITKNFGVESENMRKRFPVLLPSIYPTGIEGTEINDRYVDDSWYTMTGIKVDKPMSGNMYIHRGRKILIK